MCLDRKKTTTVLWKELGSSRNVLNNDTTAVSPIATPLQN